MSAPDFTPLVVPPADHSGTHRYVHVVGAAVWIDDRPAERDWSTHFIGLVDGEAWWGVDVPVEVDPSDGAAVDLRAFYGRSPEHHWLAAGVPCRSSSGRVRTASADAVARRQKRSRGSARCAARDARCSAFPRLAPAMITLVTRGDGDEQEALLARGVQWTVPMFSLSRRFRGAGRIARIGSRARGA